MNHDARAGHFMWLTTPKRKIGIQNTLEGSQ
jgi:hypothetical protein